jgi:hypothetical protein
MACVGGRPCSSISRIHFFSDDSSSLLSFRQFAGISARALRPLIQWVRVERGTLYVVAAARMLLNWLFLNALIVMDMQSSNLLVNSACFEAIFDEELNLMMIWCVVRFRG